jgi:hypothetical protein
MACRKEETRLNDIEAFVGLNILTAFTPAYGFRKGVVDETWEPEVIVVTNFTLGPLLTH